MLGDSEPVPVVEVLGLEVLDGPSLPGFEERLVIPLGRPTSGFRHESPRGVGMPPKDPVVPEVGEQFMQLAEVRNLVTGLCLTHKISPASCRHPDSWIYLIASAMEPIVASLGYQAMV